MVTGTTGNRTAEMSIEASRNGGGGVRYRGREPVTIFHGERSCLTGTPGGVKIDGRSDVGNAPGGT
jgi:hypothetical protein